MPPGVTPDPSLDEPLDGTRFDPDFPPVPPLSPDPALPDVPPSLPPPPAPAPPPSPLWSFPFSPSVPGEFDVAVFVLTPDVPLELLPAPAPPPPPPAVAVSVPSMNMTVAPPPPPPDPE